MNEALNANSGLDRGGELRIINFGDPRRGSVTGTGNYGVNPLTLVPSESGRQPPKLTKSLKRSRPVTRKHGTRSNAKG